MTRNQAGSAIVPAATQCVCSDPWMVHANIPVVNPSDDLCVFTSHRPISAEHTYYLPSAITPNRWVPPTAPNHDMSVNQRRMDHSSRNGVTSSGLVARTMQTRASVLRGPSHPYPPISAAISRCTSRGFATQTFTNVPVTYTYSVYVIPHGVSNYFISVIRSLTCHSLQAFSNTTPTRVISHSLVYLGQDFSNGCASLRITTSTPWYL